MSAFDPQELVSLFGLRNAVLRGDELIASCPTGNHRNGDAHPSFAINVEKGLAHCFAGETRVITRDGVFEMSSLAGRDVEVINGNGEWERVRFVDCGVQRLMRVRLSRDGVESDIFATAEHEWLIKRRKAKKKTCELSDSDYLEIMVPNIDMSDIEPSVDGLIHGFVFGDGHISSKSKCSKTFHYAVKGYDEHKVDFMRRVFSRVKSYGGSKERYCDGRYELQSCFTSNIDMKKVPSPDAPLEYIYGFLAGYFVADGNCTANCNQIDSVDLESLVKVRHLFLLCGIPSTSIRKRVRPVGCNMGCVPNDRGYPIYGLTFSRCHTPNSFYVSGKRPDAASNFFRLRPRVVSVERTDRIEHVYCCETSTGSFVLDDFVLTGNCMSCGYSANLVQMCRDILGLDEREAVGALYRDLTPEDIDRMSAGGRRTPRKAVSPVQAAQSAWRSQKHPYWRNRGFDDATVGKWGLGYDASCNRVTVPVYMGGQLVGWQKRRVDDALQADEPKWRSAPSMNRNLVMFGLDEAVRTGSGTAILVEAPLSAVMLDQQGFHGGVASFGCQLSDEHALTLRRLFDRVIVFYDPDEAGDRGTVGAVNRLSPFMDVLVVPDSRDDPAAQTAEENRAALDSAVPGWLWEPPVRAQVT